MSANAFLRNAFLHHDLFRPVVCDKEQVALTLTPNRIDANSIGDHGNGFEWSFRRIWITLLDQQREDWKCRHHNRGLMLLKTLLELAAEGPEWHQARAPFAIRLTVNKVPEPWELIDGKAITLAKETVAARIGFLEEIYGGHCRF